MNLLEESDDGQLADRNAKNRQALINPTPFDGQAPLLR